MNIRNLSSLLCFILLVTLAACTSKEPAKILVFSKTKGFRHSSIEPGIAAIRLLGAKYNVGVDTTENAANFNEDNLKQYRAIVFLNTTGDVLDQAQQNVFERYIQAGGGYVGIHAATDAEYQWPWYGKLVGAYFNGHPGNPNVQKGTYHVVEKNNPATDSLPDPWERSDEFYNFKEINPDIKPLLSIDESTYKGGTNGGNHPMAWYHDFDGGRSFYTNLGHTNESFSDPLFLKHLWGGIKYAMGESGKLDFSKVHTQLVPAENRFTITILEEKLDEPMELTVLPGNKVLYIERKGALKLFDPSVGSSKTLATLPVSTKYHHDDGSETEAEDGLLGLTKDPDFEKNHWIYLYYSPSGDVSENILTRYELKDDQLVEASKKILLHVGTQRKECCHTGGSLTFDGNGNLFLSTGDNTSPRATAYSPADEMPGRFPWDAQKSAANTNDLRGKVLRIHPEPDGSYTIPEGNLFPKGTEKTRPEIYVMGNRNPFRISVDNKTGYLYWGEVGPDAGKDSTGFGPKGYDEFNQARKPGYFGWPYFIGNNQAYDKYDFAKKTSGPKRDVNKPINTSPNNTGLNEIPVPQSAFIWYPYGESKEFPLVGSGGRTAMAGPVFYSDDFKSAERPFPDYYNGKLLIYEWMRGWIMAVTMDKDGNYVSMERFMPDHKFSNPMDMEFSSDGDLYILEYGTRWFQGNDDARILKIDYNGGNRKPITVATASEESGAIPLTVQFTSTGTSDPDNDKLTYGWKFINPDSSELKSASGSASEMTFDKPGAYLAVLTVTDDKGASSSSTIQIVAGNEPPVVTLDTKANKTFFFKDLPFDYEVKVTDKEDGSLADGKISADAVKVTGEYLQDGAVAIPTPGHQDPGTVAVSPGKKLMDGSDCKSCHAVDKKSIGPAYQQIATKYKDDPKAIDGLSKKVINGGAGVWGDVAMAAHPQLSSDNAKEIVRYILSMSTESGQTSMPARGTFKVTVPKGQSDQGVYLLKATYSDRGANSLPPASGSASMILRNPMIAGGALDANEGIMKFAVGPMNISIGTKTGAALELKGVDMTNLSGVRLIISAPIDQLNAAGGTMEIHRDSPDGPVLGVTETIVPTNKQSAMNMVPRPSFVKFAPSEATNDLYFVFRNPKSPSGQSLFVLVMVEFVPSTSKPL